MLCDNCKKKQATVYVENIINGQHEKMNLCEECAMSKGQFIPFSFNLSNFFSDVNGLNEEINGSKCSNCGLTFAQFEKSGVFGCCKCYSDMRSDITPVIKRIHGRTTHEDSRDICLDSKNLKIQELKAKLSEAILKEEFEYAAKLRDEIKLLEGGNSNDTMDN